MTRILVVSWVLIRWSVVVAVQNGAAADGRPTFEVASIKAHPDRSGVGGGSCTGTDSRPSGGPLALLAGRQMAAPPPGTCAFTNVTLPMLMASAWQFGAASVLGTKPMAGTPDWFHSARFDIQAKADRPTTVSQLLLMLQRLLEDRFALEWHRESRPADGFALVVGSGGLRMSKGENAGGRISRTGPNPWSGRNVTLDELARFLAGRLDRPVANQTDLHGGYNFTLTWTPGDGERIGLPGVPPGVAAQIPRADPVDGPSLFTAVQEQLGLRLERRQVLNEVVVIDGVRLPDAN